MAVDDDGREPVQPAPLPRVSHRELGKRMNIFEILDEERGPQAINQAEEIAASLGKRL